MTSKQLNIFDLVAVFLKIIRRRHCDVTDLNQLFKSVSFKKIFDFINNIDPSDGI